MQKHPQASLTHEVTSTHPLLCLSGYLSTVSMYHLTSHGSLSLTIILITTHWGAFTPLRTGIAVSTDFPHS